MRAVTTPREKVPMQVVKWRDGLAVRLPAAVVEALQLKEGDDIEIHVVDSREFALSRKPRREGLLARFPRALSCRLQVRPERGQCPVIFFDTIVLLYLASGASAKAEPAEPLVCAGGAISVQVRNEIANVARRKMAMSWAETRAFLSTVRALLPAHPITIEIHENQASARRALWTVGLGRDDRRLGRSRRLRHAVVRRNAGWDPLDDRLGIVNPFRAL